MGGVADRILALHGWVALLVLFALPALESSAFVGFLFPGEIAVLLGGVLAFQHRVSLPAAIAATVAGAVIGDSIGYEVGKRWGRSLLEGTVGRLVKHHHLERAERYLATKGGKAVFFGRFTAALRVLVPGLAGMSGLDYRTFLTYNAAGGVIWATGFVFLGYAAGSSWRQVEHVAKRASLVLLLLLVLVGALVLVTRWGLRNQQRLEAFVRRQAQRPRVAALGQRYRSQLDFLADRLRPGGALGLSLTGLLAVLALVGWGFGTVVQDVIGGDDAARFDRPILAFFAHHREPWLTTVMRVLTNLGSGRFLIPAIAVAGGVWWVKRRDWHPAAHLGAAYAGAFLLSQVVKFLAQRPRPPSSLSVGLFDGFAFPSGHAAQAAAVWGMAAALVTLSSSRWSRKVLAWTGASLIVLLVGVTRLYLGAHWPTDVLGGWALGALWLAFILLTAHAVRAIRPARGVRRDASAKPRPRATPSGQ